MVTSLVPSKVLIRFHRYTRCQSLSVRTVIHDPPASFSIAAKVPKGRRLFRGFAPTNLVAYISPGWYVCDEGGEEMTSPNDLKRSGLSTSTGVMKDKELLTFIGGLGPAGRIGSFATSALVPR